MRVSISNCPECGELCFSTAEFCPRCEASLLVQPESDLAADTFGSILCQAEVLPGNSDLETSVAPVSSWRRLVDSGLTLATDQPVLPGAQPDPFQQILDRAEFQDTTVSELNENDSRALLESMFAEASTSYYPVIWSKKLPRKSTSQTSPQTTPQTSTSFFTPLLPIATPEVEWTSLRTIAPVVVARSTPVSVEVYARAQPIIPEVVPQKLPSVPVVPVKPAN